MARIPSLISGHVPDKITAQRKSSCRNCKHPICANDECFEIPERGYMHTKKKRYCYKCFEKIINKTEQDLKRYSKLL